MRQRRSPGSRGARTGVGAIIWRHGTRERAGQSRTGRSFFVSLPPEDLSMADGTSPDVVAELAPTGRLRAAINFGNSVLAQEDAAGGPPRGVSAELARELARRLGIGIDYVTFDAAGKVFEALKAGLWDIAFLAIDPVRAAGIDFTAPYVVIEGVYVVPKDSSLHTVADVDRDGVRV